MSTTSAYGWNIPDNTDLVKDGALAIRTLGNAIDTSMNTALGTKKAGMVLLNTTSFSGVTSVSLAQDTFTSTYRNYRIILNFLPVTNLSILNVRFRKTGSDNSTSNYFYSGISTVHNSGSITVNNGNGVTAISTPANMSNNANNLLVMDLADVQNSLNPKFNMQLTHSGVGHQTSGGYLGVSDAFDALTFYMNTGNFSGRYQIFGVNE